MKNHANSLHSNAFLKMFLFVLLFSSVFVLKAQSVWLPNTQGKHIALEWLKPSFENADDISFLTSAQFLSGKFRVNERLFFVAELPFAFYNEDNSDAEFAIGNPYLGLEIRNSDQPHFFEVGLRAPLASDEKFSATLTGLLTDYDRAEAYLNDLFAVTGRYNYWKKNESNLILRFRGGPTFWIPTSDENLEDPEVLLDYSAQAGYDGPQFQALGGFTGRAIITESGDFDERTVHHFGVSAHYKANKVTPGLLLRFPLDDDIGDFIDFVFGLHVLVNLDQP